MGWKGLGVYNAWKRVYPLSTYAWCYQPGWLLHPIIYSKLYHPTLCIWMPTWIMSFTWKQWYLLKNRVFIDVLQFSCSNKGVCIMVVMVGVSVSMSMSMDHQKRRIFTYSVMQVSSGYARYKKTSAQWIDLDTHLSPPRPFFPHTCHGCRYYWSFHQESSCSLCSFRVHRWPVKAQQARTHSYQAPRQGWSFHWSTLLPSTLVRQWSIEKEDPWTRRSWFVRVVWNVQGSLGTCF